MEGVGGTGDDQLVDNGRSDEKSTPTDPKIIRIGLVLVAVWMLQVGLGYVDALGLGPLAAGLFLIGVVAFYGFYSVGLGMRATITASFVSVYLALLSAFLTSERTRMQIEDAAGDEVWEGFTWLVGVIVISYFGATVASEAIGTFGASRQATDSPST